MNLMSGGNWSAVEVAALRRLGILIYHKVEEAGATGVIFGFSVISEKAFIFPAIVGANVGWIVCDGSLVYAQLRTTQETLGDGKETAK